MEILAVFGAIYLIFNLIKEACEPTIPAEYYRNWRLERDDMEKVYQGQLTQKQFEKNIKNGKYR